MHPLNQFHHRPSQRLGGQQLSPCSRSNRCVVSAAHDKRQKPDPATASVDLTAEALRTIIIQTQPQVVRPAEEKSFTDANFPVDAEGRSLHLGTRRGEVANRVLSVGSMDRALRIADLLEPPRAGAPLFQHLSSRGFFTITGRYQGVPVSVVTTLMGLANMDFVVRECKAAVDGQMAVVRLGTCGAVRAPAALGQLIVARDGAVCVRREPDAWALGGGREPYSVTAPAPADAKLTALLEAAAAAEAGAESVVGGLNATCDSFYGAQGRTGGPFDDRNDGLIPWLLERCPDVISLEMETFGLLHLAQCSRGAVVGAAMCIALAERYSNSFLPAPRIAEREMQGGRAALAALTRFALQDDASMGAGAGGSNNSDSSSRGRPVGGYVWEDDYVETSAAGSGGNGSGSSGSGTESGGGDGGNGAGHGGRVVAGRAG